MDGMNTSSSVDRDPVVEERLRRRYPPPRVPRPVIITLVAVGAIAALVWLLWVASVRSSPPVSGQVSTYTVVSETQIDLTLTVDRPDPSIPVVCTVIAQAANFERVGEMPVEVAASEHRVVDVPVSLKTFHEATSASLDHCAPA